MSGLFVAIVGPSGAGKDSLIRELAARFADDPAFLIVRRVVTRVADVHEDHASLDVATFEAKARAGSFALTWSAHGLLYGVPSDVDDALVEGRTAVCNLSRTAVGEARRRWPRTFVVGVVAQPDILAARLRTRGREPESGVRARLARLDFAEAPDAVVENDDLLQIAADRLYMLVQNRRNTLA